jgi:hypothetical protein
LRGPSSFIVALRAVRAVDGVIDVESQLGYAIDDIRLPHDADQLETVVSSVPRLVVPE